MTDSKDVQSNTPRQSQSSQHHRSQTVIAQISSPLPPPEMLAAYERAQPGLIDKIIEMAEAESNHRRGLEKQKILEDVSSLQREDKLTSRAQIFAFILGMSTIVAGATAAIHGAQIAGGIIGTAGIAGIIVAYLKNSRRKG